MDKFSRLLIAVLVVFAIGWVVYQVKWGLPEERPTVTVSVLATVTIAFAALLQVRHLEKAAAVAADQTELMRKSVEAAESSAKQSAELARSTKALADEAAKARQVQALPELNRLLREYVEPNAREVIRISQATPGFRFYREHQWDPIAFDLSRGWNMIGMFCIHGLVSTEFVVSFHPRLIKSSWDALESDIKDCRTDMGNDQTIDAPFQWLAKRAEEYLSKSKGAAEKPEP